MISIIICSIDPVQLSALRLNINSTIGTRYEIIAIDNRNTGKGICQVYNEGVGIAQYEILCFIHEDIIIETNDWGLVLMKLFTDPQLGLVGVAGSTYRPLTPTKWGGIGGRTIYKNYIQSFKFQDKPDLHCHANPKLSKLSVVTCVDGVWLSTTKKIALAVKFDQQNFTNFHLYDMDFSMSVLQQYKVAVTFEILVKHLSEGSYSKEWMEDNLKYFEKWSSKLPIDLEGLSRKEILHGEKFSFKNLIDQLIYYQYPITTAFKLLRSGGYFFKLKSKLFLKLQFYILKKYLKRNSELPESLL